MPARLYACAADARAPQPAVCQAPIGAIGFRPPTARLRLSRPSEARSAERGADANPAARAPQAFQRAGAASCQAPFGAIGFRLPTARLRLRRPSDARSAERGRYLCSTPSSLTTVSSASFAFPEGGRASGRVQRRASGRVRGGPPASGSLLRAAAAGPLPPRATPPAACVCAAGVCAVRGTVSVRLSMRMSPSRDRRESKENDQHARRRCSGRTCCRHPVCCSWQHCCWAGRVIGDGCLADNVWNDESSYSKHANVFFCSCPGTSAWKGTSWQGRPCTRSLLRRGCPPRSRPRRLRFGA
jgi:hypothetical protein